MFYKIKKSKLGDWIKKNKKDILLFVIAFLIISLSFGLGYMVAKDYSQKPIIINTYK